MARILGRVLGYILFGFSVIGLSMSPLAAQQEDTSAAAETMAREVPESNTQVMLSYSPVVKKVAPAVVNIYTKKVVQVQASPLFNDPFFRRFFGNNNPFGMPQERIQGALGSGVIVRPNGIIVTNNHVIGGADSIQVVLPDRREFEAQVVLADPRTDLAVLKIDAGDEDLPYLEFYDSDAVEVGDISLALGNPFGVGQTVTSGIVSATARTNQGISDFQFFIQTDAAVNPGNSGGALVGLDGRLMGINTAIFSRSGDSSGIGFAIPSNMVKTVVEAALAGGAIVRPWVGFSGTPVDFQIAQSLGLERPGGILVDSTYPGGPAEAAGLLPGDIILMVDGKEVIDNPGFSYRIATAGVGSQVMLEINRGGEVLDLPISLELPPENPPRDTTVLDGRHLFQQVKVANLSPRLAEEIGVDINEKGVIVLEVDPRSPAGRRNFIRPGDVILSLNGEPIDVVSDLVTALEVESDDYIYELRRQGRLIQCGLIGSRSFYCQEG